MNKKLIITEEQYKKLKFKLLESQFDVLANKVIKRGDTLTITMNGKENNFEVVDNVGGQIYMDNIDSGSEYFEKRVFLTNTSFQDNNLIINVAKDDVQKNEKPLKGNTWQKMTLKNVEDISVKRGDKFIDGTNFNPNEEKYKERKKEFLNSLNELNDGESLTLKTPGITLKLNYMESTNDVVSFELDDETKKQMGDNISSIEISKKEEDINVGQNGALDVKYVEYVTDGDKIDKKEGTIKKVSDWELNSISDADDEPEEEEDKKQENEIDPEKLKNLLLNDPQLKAAFYSKPSFFQSFWAELTSQNPNEKATGYNLVKNLIDDYVGKKVNEKLGNNFLKKGKITFEPLETVDILYRNSKGGNEYFTLQGNTIYKDENSVSRESFDESNASNSDYNLILSNKNNFEIIVKEKTETPNVFLCDIIKLYKLKSKQNPKKMVTMRSEPKEDVEIRFLDSQGYKSETQQN